MEIVIKCVLHVVSSGLRLVGFIIQNVAIHGTHAHRPCDIPLSKQNDKAAVVNEFIGQYSVEFITPF